MSAWRPKAKKTLRLTERRTTALHEAGHAVVSAVLGYPTRVDLLRVCTSDGIAAGGNVVFAARPYRDEMAICFGGPLAEMRVGVSVKEAFGVSGWGDIQQVFAILRKYYPANEKTQRWTEAQRRAREIIEQHEAKWMEIANALLRSEVVRVEPDLTVREVPEERAEALAYWEGPGEPLNAYPDPANDNYAT